MHSRRVSNVSSSPGATGARRTSPRRALPQSKLGLMAEALRLTEILTTSSAVANYLGARTVEAQHVLLAIAILEGSKTLDDLGRPQSPLISRVTGAGSGVAEEVRELAQRWFAAFEGDVLREFSEGELHEFVEELRMIDERRPPGV